MSLVAPLTPAALTQALSTVLDELLTPALVIDLDAVAHNLRATLARVGGPARWRPHIKTCKQAVILEAMLDAGLDAFKVATCDELALLLETAGERRVDVLVAYPAQPAALRAVLALAAAHPSARVQLLADSPAHLETLGRALEQRSDAPVPVMLDVDLGMQRTGSPPPRWRALERVPAGLELSGLHGYDGHIGWDEPEAAARGYDALCSLAEELDTRLHAPAEPFELVTSGTHSYAHALAHPGLAHVERWQHRVSPGTVVLSDLRSHRAAADIGLRQAAFVASRVISVGEGRVTLDAGSKGISPDVPPPNCAVLDHPELSPRRASEEHLPCTVATDAEAPSLGQLMWLVPAHVCTTVNLHREAVWIRDAAFAGTGAVVAAGHRPRAPGTALTPK